MDIKIKKKLLLILVLNTQAVNGSYFDSSLLDIDESKSVDLSIFEKGLSVPPGFYKVRITMNNNEIATKEVNFKVREKEESKGLFACMDKTQIEELGVKESITVNLDLAGKCYFLSDVMDGVREEYIVEKHQLMIFIPQIYISEKPQGYINPSLWDEGVNALSLNYQYNGVGEKNNGKNQNKQFLNIISGLNLNSWHLRNYSTYNSINEGGKKNESIYSYAQKNIISLNSQLVVGNGVATGELFDSVKYSGVSLFTDENMFPDSNRGFAPVIRGMAKTNAILEIRQNGFLIYQRGLSAGPFEITDLYPSSYSGDLYVTIIEENKNTYSYSVPYSTIPIFQREGRWKYNAIAGWLRDERLSERKGFYEATLYKGMKFGTTIFGGMQLTDNYKAYALGVGKNLGSFGAASLDVTVANSELNTNTKAVGKSIRFLYSKSLNVYGTNFQLFGYRYSTENYYSLSEAQALLAEKNDPIHNYFLNKKSSINATLSQTVGDIGSIYINASRKNYWRKKNPESNAQIGYTGNVGSLNYNFNMNIAKEVSSEKLEKSYSLNLTIPLSSGRTYFTTTTSYDSKNKVNGSSGINGTLLDNNLGYSLQQGHGANVDSGQTNINYQGDYLNTYAGYSYNNSNKQIMYGFNGSSVIHADGLTHGPFLGNTGILVEAKGATGVTLQNTRNIKIDSNGYAIVPYASEFRRNRIALETTSFPRDLDVEQSIIEVAPTKGAIVKATFNTQLGNRVLFNLTYNKKTLPFGTLVKFVGSQNITGIVNEESRVYLSGIPESGSLTFQGLDNHDCIVPYNVKGDGNVSVQKVSLNCDSN